MKGKIFALVICFVICVFCSAIEVSGEYLSEEISAEIKEDIPGKIQNQIDKIMLNVRYKNEEVLRAETLSGKLRVILTNKHIITVDNKGNMENLVKWTDIYYCSYENNTATLIFFGKTDNPILHLKLDGIVDKKIKPKSKKKTNFDEIGKDTAEWFTKIAKTVHTSDDTAGKQPDSSIWQRVWQRVLQHIWAITTGIMTAFGGLIVLFVRRKLKIE